MRNSTLIFLVKRDKDQKITDLCLAMKKRGFGVGRWNGVGGKVSEGESIEEAAKRETLEEINVSIEDLFKTAELDFIFPHNPSWNQTVHVYTTSSWKGEPEESEEMKPEWFKVDKIPFNTMWPDDIFWLPKVIEGKLIKGKFEFGEGDVIKSQDVRFVESF
jgi:8-oxo-dGTP diphosphatase / 2-hydroxy-dATP diphosphatase